MFVVNWKFWKRSQPGRTLTLRSRGEASSAQRVDITELAPDVEVFLGQAAYLQLGYFETLTRLIRATEDLHHKESIAKAAGAALRKHQGLVALIRARGDEPTETMLPFREELDAFRWKTIGARREETMLSVHLTAGMLDDFYRTLATSYGDTGRRVARILDGDHDRQAVVEILRELITTDDEWRSLLSLWGRRLVGDTLLVARAALQTHESFDQDDEERVEPVYTELMGAHSRRMEALGLNA